MHPSTTVLLILTLSMASLPGLPAESQEPGASDPELGACGEPATPIHQIQGAGHATPLERGTPVVVEGVVVGDFRDPDLELGGFFVQEEDADTDAHAATSEGLFVYDRGFEADIEPGQLVRVRGAVQEFFGQTELADVSHLVACRGRPELSPVRVRLPVADPTVWERWEGMAIRIEQPLVISGQHDLDRFGELTLSAGGRLWRPTQQVRPGPAAERLADANARRSIVLDDGSDQWHPVAAPHDGAAGMLRLGDRVRALEGVVAFGFGRYAIQPTSRLRIEHSSQRPAHPPSVGGTLRIATLNLHNYFNGDGVGGGFPTPRGAESALELERQQAKLVETLALLDADAIGVVEIENDGFAPGSAIHQLTEALSRRMPASPYAFASPARERLGEQAIAVGILYRPAALAPLGPAVVLDEQARPEYDSSRNRPSLAQGFEAHATGERFTLAVSHLKSKGSSCKAAGDPDRGDGQGNCNGVRRLAARALAEWLAGDPTGSADPDFLIVGDLNAYALEDPIEEILSSGFVDLVGRFRPGDGYSFVFDGEAGRLDHALASASLLPHVSGTRVWHINADESQALDYRLENPPELYSASPWRSSDHDPIVVGLFPDRNGDGLTELRDACPARRKRGGRARGSRRNRAPRGWRQGG